MKISKRLGRALLLPTALMTLAGVSVPALGANADSNYNQNANDPVAYSSSGYGKDHHQKQSKGIIEIQPGTNNSKSNRNSNKNYDANKASKNANKHPSSNNKMLDNKNSQEIRKDAIGYINHARSTIGLNQLKINPLAQKVADQRAVFSADNNTVAHRDAKGNHYANPLFSKLGYKGDWSEDSGNSSIAPGVRIDVFNTQAPVKNGKRSTDNGKDGNHYTIDTPKQCAFADIDAMINHDGPDYGHRDSLLTPYAAEMGVSVAYSKKSKSYYLIIDILQNLPHDVTKTASGKYTYPSNSDNTYVDKKYTSQSALKTIYNYQKIANFYTTHHNVMINLK